MRDTQLRPKDVALHRGAVALPATASFLNVKGAAVVTSARQVGECLEVRLFNPTTKRVKSTLRGWDGHFNQAQPVNFESYPAGEKRALKKGALSVELTPEQILTLRLTA